MKSCYRNSIPSPTYDKLRVEHDVHYTTPSSPKLRKYDHAVTCVPSDHMKPRADTHPFPTHTPMKYRPQEHKDHPRFVLGSTPPDVPRLPKEHYPWSLNSTYYKSYPTGRTYHGIPTNHQRVPENYRPPIAHIDTKSVTSQSVTSHFEHVNRACPPRSKCSPYPTYDKNSYNPSLFYRTDRDVEKPNADPHHKGYANYQHPLKTPCRPLPFFSGIQQCEEPVHDSFKHTPPPRVGDSYRRTGDSQARGDSVSPIYSPPITRDIKKSDYPVHYPILSSREPGENGAFSPVRPSHVRRVRSTESGYSSESNGNSTHALNGYPDNEKCNNPKCCGTQEVGHHTKHLSISDDRDRNNNLPNHEKIPNGHHPGFPHTRRPYDDLPRHDDEYRPMQRVNEQFQPKTSAVFPARRLSSSFYEDHVNKNLWREYSHKHREYNNEHSRAYDNSPDKDSRSTVNNGLVKPWKNESDFNGRDDVIRLNDKPETRDAMKTFDSHIRQMISMTSRNNHSLDYSTKYQHLVNQSNHSFRLTIEDKHSFSRPHGNVRNQSRDGKRPSYQLDQLLAPSDTHLDENNSPSDKQFEEKLSPSDKKLDEKLSPSDKKLDQRLSPSDQQLDEKLSLSDEDIKSESLDCTEEVQPSPPPSPTLNEENISLDKTIKQENNAVSSESTIHADSESKETIAERLACDSTQLTTIDHGTEDDTTETGNETNIDDNDNEEEDKKEDQSSQPLELQCPAVDSTLNDESTPTSGIGGLLGLTKVANEHLGQALAKEKRRSKNNNCLHLWQFLRRMLDQEQDKVGRCIEWTNRETGEFRLIKTSVIADLWGQSKNRTCMTYEKMARAMRYYYKMNILEKVPHKRLHFRFGERILSKVLHMTTPKPPPPTPFVNKNKIFNGMYNINKRALGTNFPQNNLLKGDGKDLMGHLRTFPSLNYMKYQPDCVTSTIQYRPAEPRPSYSIPQYYTDPHHHGNNIHHPDIPHIRTPTVPTNRITDRSTLPRDIPDNRVADALPNNNIPRKVVTNGNALCTTSPGGSNPSVSPCSGEITPDVWSDVDSDEDLNVDTVDPVENEKG